MWARALVSGATCALVAVALAACSADHGATADASTNRPITILWIGHTTGPLKVYGDVQLAGVKGAAAYFNRHGGIAGHHVEVHAVSDNGDPATAAAVLTKQLTSGTPTMVWPGSVSSDSAAMIPILARHHVFAISLVDGQAQCQTDATVRCPNLWSLAAPTSVAQQGVVDWITARHFTKVGVLEETTPESASETPPFLAAAAKASLAVTTASFPPTALDLTPELQALQQKGAQVVYAEGIGSAQYALAGRVNQTGGSTNVDKLDAAMLRLRPADPLRTLSHRLGWSESDHENVRGAPADYAVFPVGPLVNGRIQDP